MIKQAPMMLYCNKCKCETTHYFRNKKSPVCAKCQKVARDAAKLKRREDEFNKKSRDLANNIVQPRQYNLMTAPIYTGENWINARGQMAPTTRYISAGASV